MRSNVFILCTLYLGGEGTRKRKTLGKRSWRADLFEAGLLECERLCVHVCVIGCERGSVSVLPKRMNAFDRIKVLQAQFQPENFETSPFENYRDCVKV